MELQRDQLGGSATPRIVILFSAPATAAHSVAGLPAAARALREAVLAGIESCVLATPRRWTPGPAARIELERLGHGMAWAIRTESAALHELVPGDLLVSGERLVPSAVLVAALAGHRQAGIAVVGEGAIDHLVLKRLRNGGGQIALDAASRAIVRATAKPQDGIVSRYLNRPISQALTRLLLHWPSIRPEHATALTALAALAMVLALVLGGESGLVAGALLFQLASIIDGVDGEIARATFRTSARGARIDSFVDAATNLAFLAGVAWNLLLRGEAAPALAGLASLMLLATGLWLIARNGRSRGAILTFDAVKERVLEHPSPIRRILTWITMRDFFALVVALAIVAGFAHLILFAFAIFAAGWLAVVVTVMHRRTTS